MLWKNDKSLIGQVDKQNITIHRWFANTLCPGDYIVSQLNYVADEVNKILLPKVKEIQINKNYTVRVVPMALYYRSGPGINYPVRGIVRKNEIFTIVDESVGLGSSKWGKLKSGAGWISLDHCTKL